jgi:hypothetical protein
LVQMKLPPFRQAALVPESPASSGAAGRWVVGIASILIASTVVGVFLASRVNRGPGRLGQPTHAATARDASTDALSSQPFICQGGTGLGSGPVTSTANVVAVETSVAVGYERLRITFSPVVPNEASVSVQPGTIFTEAPSGRAVRLEGKYGILLTLHPADGHSSYTGPTDLKPRFAVMDELRQIEDSGGSVEWAVGLARAPCYRVAYLTDPLRLAVDFRAD